MIGGITAAILQQNNADAYNEIGEKIPGWTDVQTIVGFLDLSNGDSKYTYNAKIQESTHIFMCDFVPIDRNADDKRMVIDGIVYDVLLIDNPMEMCRHLEIYLKQTGR